MEVDATDAALFQHWMFARQYPADCRATIGVLTRAGTKPSGERYPGDYFFGLGLGSQMASLKFNFVDALLKGKIYHFPTSHYVNPLRCASRKFDCYFESPTNCTTETSGMPPLRMHKAIASAPLLWCFELPRRRLSRLAGLKAVHSEAWYHAQLAAFLFRPNAAMSKFRSRLLPHLAFDANYTRASTVHRDGSTTRMHNGSCVSMHVRRTDKFRGRRREDSRNAVRITHNRLATRMRPCSRAMLLALHADIDTESPRCAGGIWWVQPCVQSVGPLAS